MDGAEQAGENRISRRTLMKRGALASAALGMGGVNEAKGMAAEKPDDRKRSPKVYPMKKSINLWAFPYPQRMSLRECFELAKNAGFDGVEVNYDLDGDISPKASDQDLQAIGAAARDIGIAVSGVCSFLFWPYSLTHNDPEKRSRGIDLARGMIGAAGALGTENLLVVPGAVHVPWDEEHVPVPYDVAHERARRAIKALIPHAEKHKVYINIENIFMNGFLMSPMEMNYFVDQFDHPRVRIHFDTGNIMQFQYPEHWIPLMGKRIQNVHLKEFTKKGTDVSLESFRPLLDGTTNWPAVMEAFDRVGYRGYLTFEYFHPYAHYPEALIYHSSDALDRILGRRA